jgi:hypothetical protein
MNLVELKSSPRIERCELDLDPQVLDLAVVPRFDRPGANVNRCRTAQS